MANNALFDDSVVDVWQYYSNKYGKNERVEDKVKEFYKAISSKRMELLDTFSSVASLCLLIENNKLPNHINPQLQEAFNLAYPTLDINQIFSYTSEQLQGIVIAWQGKYFEVLVRDQLNNGDIVGNYCLKGDQTAILASSPTQEGWDLRIINTDGLVCHEIQLKATDSVSYINAAIEKFPNFPILTTEEVSHSMVSNSEISNEVIKQAIADVVNNTSLGIFDAVSPIIPFALIVMTESIAVIMGNTTKDEAIKKTFDRSSNCVVSVGCGNLVYLCSGSWMLSVLASLTVMPIYKKYAHSNKELTEYIKIETEKLKSIISNRSVH